MFGQPSTSPFGAPAPSTPFGAPAPAPFGAPAPAPFGAPAPAFGAPAPAMGFGAPAPTGFGTTTGFGAPATGFGVPSPAPAFGGFGAAPAPATGFGAPATGGLFGSAPTPAPGGLFGAARAPAPTGLFGAPAPAAPGTSLFGAPAAPTTPFGSPAPAPAFGAPAPGGLFGSAPAPAFGAPAPAPGAFGAPTPAPAFGAAPAPAFGAAPTGGLFGMGAQQQKPGTLAAPYQSTNKTDGTNQITLHAISAMPQYESKSFEELRLEDYMSGNRGSQGQAPAPAGGFGFGSPAPAPAFGAPQPAPSTGLFGAPAPAPTGGLFGGAPTPAPGGLFGTTTAPAPSGGLFGTPAPTPAPGTSLFGAPSPAPGAFGFGAPAPAPAFGAKPGGLFGSAPTPAPSTGLFGAPAAPAPTGLFGAPAPPPAPGTSLFGAPPAPAPAFGFGSPAPASAFGAKPGGLFGAPTPAPSTGLFGAPATPAPGGLFGASSTPAPATGGLFGSSAPAGGGLFGAPAPAPGTSLFGAPTAAPTGGLFGAPAPSTSLFGAPPAAQAPAIAAVPAAPPPSAEAILAQQLAAVENQKKNLELLEAWRGNPPSGAKVVPSSLYESDSYSVDNWSNGGPSYAAPSSELVVYHAAPRSGAKIRPRGFTPSRSSPLTSLGRKNGGSPTLSPKTFAGSATKALFIKPDSMTPKPKTRLLLTDGIPDPEASGDPTVARLKNGTFGTPKQEPPPSIKDEPVQDKDQGESQHQTPTQNKASPPKPIDSVSPLISRPKESPTTNGEKPSPAQDFYKQVVGSPDSLNKSPSVASRHTPTTSAPKLTKPGYIVFPQIDKLESMPEAELAAVADFKVERFGYGSVAWDGSVDVRGVDLDSVVNIESKCVSVYDEAEANGEKPKVGSKLNRPAVITMYNIFPKDGARSSAEAKEKLQRKITKVTKKMDAELISFNSESGVWKFRVGHFSKYALDDDSDADDDSDTALKVTPTLEPIDYEQVNLHTQHSDSALFEEEEKIGGTTLLRAPSDEDEDTSMNTENISTSETSEDAADAEDDTMTDAIILAGEEAYALMTEEALESHEQEEDLHHEISPLDTDEKILYPFDDNENVIAETVRPRRMPTYLAQTEPSAKICETLAAKCGLKQTSSSNIDMGMRMSRSFRVGWCPDGSFIHLRPSCHGKQVLVQSRPIISQRSTTNSSSVQPHDSLPLLETHRKHSIKINEPSSSPPIYALPQIAHDSNSSLHDALGEYSSCSSQCSFPDATRHAVSKSFSLLKVLYEPDGIIRSEMGRYPSLEGISNWLRDVVSDDTSHEILTAQSAGDVYGAIFSALSGGNISEATSLALESGHLRLSLLLANTSSAIQPYSNLQLEMWNQSRARSFVPGGILRIFALTGGNLDTEQNIFRSNPSSYNIDWRRRFGMQLWFNKSSTEKEPSLKSIIEQYGSNLSDGLVPPATPLYVDNRCAHISSSDRYSDCVLYQILRHNVDSKVSLAEIVSPSSHTPFYFDYSSSFHLGASIASLCESRLTHYQENLLIDSLSSQLIAEGHWEWGVYVNLCVVSNRECSQAHVTARRIHAKKIVLRYHAPSADVLSDQRRTFLESIGVPPEWLNEAICYRCANEGDVFGFFQYLLNFSTFDALMAMENILAPHLLLEGEHERNESRHLLESLATFVGDDSYDLWTRVNGCEALYDFLILSNSVKKLSTMSQTERVNSGDEIADLFDVIKKLDSKICEYGELDTSSNPHSMIKIQHEVTMVPRRVLFAEIASSLSLLHTQLLALQDGGTVIDYDGSSLAQLKCSSQLATSFSSDCLFGSSTLLAGAESIARGLCST